MKRMTEARTPAPNPNPVLTIVLDNTTSHLLFKIDCEGVVVVVVVAALTSDIVVMKSGDFQLVSEGDD